MTFDPSPIFQDERWNDIAEDPGKLEQAQSKLFERYVAADPGRQRAYQEAPPETQESLRAEFGQRLEKKYPHQFKSLIDSRIKVPSIAEQVDLDYRMPTEPPEVEGQLPAAEDYARQATAQAWAANRGALGRFWDHTVAGGSLSGEIADSIVRGFSGDDYQFTKMAIARDAVRGGYESEQAGWASKTLAPVLADLPIFGLASGVSPVLLLPAMEFARQTKDLATGDAEEYNAKNLLKAGLLGAVFRYGWVPKFLKDRAGYAKPKSIEQFGSGSGLTRMASDIAGKGVKAAEASLVDPITGDKWEPEKILDTWVLFVVMDAKNTVRRGLAGRLETRLKEHGVKPEHARDFANEAILNEQRSPGDVSTLIKRAKRVADTGAIEDVAKLFRDAYARSDGRQQPASGKPAEPAPGSAPAAESAAGAAAARPRALSPGQAPTEPPAPEPPPAQQPAGPRGLPAPALKDLPAMIEQPPVPRPQLVEPAEVGQGAKPPPGPAPSSHLREVDFPVVEFPVDQLKLSQDVPNFKEDANPKTGEVRGKELQGKFDRLGTGPIIVWERANGDYEVISGRHRLAHARRTGEPTIPSQVVREADGWDKARAMILDAELNIRDGQGTVRDYADYFRAREDLTEQQARAGNLLREAKGITGWQIGKGAGDDLYAAYRAGKVSEPKAAAIAEIAPGEVPVQAAAMSEARGLSVQDLREYVKSLKAAPRTKANDSQQGDLFGFDDRVLKESKAIAKQAARAISQAVEQERTLKQAIARGDKLELTEDQAARLGITDRKDKSQLEQALTMVQAERTTLEGWHTNRELMNRFRSEAGLDPLGQAEGVREPGISYAAAVNDWRTRIQNRGPAALKSFDHIRKQYGDETAIRYAQQELRAQADLIPDMPFQLQPQDAPAPGPLRPSRKPDAGQMTLFQRVIDNKANAVQSVSHHEYRPEESANGPAAAAEAVQTFAQSMRRLPEHLRRAVTPAYSALVHELVREGHVSLKGRRVETQGDLFAIVDLLRNPRFETFRMIVLSDNRVVDEMILSSRLPGLVNFGNFQEALKEKIALLPKGSHLFLYHNHPSGNVGPSFQDRHMTRRIFEIVDQSKVTFRGHIVGNHLKFSLIDSNGRILEYTHMERGPDPLLRKSIGVLGKTIINHKELQAALRGVHEAPVLVGLSGDGIRALAHFDAALILQPGRDARSLAELRRWARSNGVSAILVANVPKGFIAKHRDALRKAFRSGVFIDVVEEGGNTFLNDHRNALLVVDDEKLFGVPLHTYRFAEPSSKYGRDLQASLPKEERQTERTEGNNWPGGTLQDIPKGSVKPSDDRNMALPIELPEMIQIYKALTGGQYPHLRKRMGHALGLFRHTDGPSGTGEIELLKSTFDLVTIEEKRAILQEAKDRAEKINKADPEAKVKWRDLYADMVAKAYQDAAKKNPVLASKVMAHELMHFVDWLPGHTLSRGNILGHIAGFKNYLMQQLSGSWEDQFIDGPFRKLTDADKARMKRDVEREIREGQKLVREIIREEPIFAEVQLTPEMVLNIWKSNEAREQFPELYEFIARMDRDEKKAVIAAAMKGAIHDALNAVRSRTQVGTRQVIDRVPVEGQVSPEEFKKRFHERIEQEMRARGIIWRGGIVKELKPLITWWRGAEEFEQYFSSGTEMYAEAGSIFLNNPAAVRTRAPMYYRAMMTWMQNNPKWYGIYHQLQDDIRSGKIYKDRVKNLRESVLAATDNEVKMQEIANRRTMREKADAFLYTFVREFGPVYWRLKKLDNPNQRWKTKQAISDYLYRKAHHELYLGRVRNEVMAPLLESNLDAVDLFEYMFHQWVVHGRHSIANPYGWTSKASGERLAEMQQQFGGDRWKALVNSQRAFWHIRQEEVMASLRRAQVFDDELMQKIENEMYYATIAPAFARGDADPEAIQTMLQARYGAVVGNIYKQSGWLGEIKNPFLATMQKDLSLLNMAYRETAKRTIVETMMSSPLFNKEWQPAKMPFTGRRLEPVHVENNRVNTLYYLHKGQLRAYYGPRAMVDQFMYGDALESSMLAKVAYHASRHFQNLWTQLNYGFWPVAYMRDIGAFRDQMPGATRFGKKSYWHYRKRALAAAKSSVLGKPNPDARHSLAKLDLITHPDPYGMGKDDTPVDQLMRQYHLEPVNWRGNEPGRVNAILRELRHLFELYRSWGQTRERAVKIAGRMFLEDNHPNIPEARKSEIIHEMSGSPNFLEHGAGNIFVNAFAPFYNPIKEGVYSGFKSIKERPGESFLKFLKYTILPLLALEALRRGWLQQLLGNEQSRDVSDMLNSIPRYDWDNYKVVPLGWVDKQNKKVAYLRIPMHERERVMRGAVAKLLRADEDPVNGTTLLNIAGGQLPGLNPLIEIGAAWYTYGAMGRAPVDLYSGSRIMTDDQAGAGEGTGELLRYTANNLGASIVVRFNKYPLDAAEPTWLEKVLRLPIISNSLGRWVKVSNRGVTESFRPITDAIEKQRAKTRLDAQRAIERLLNKQPLSADDVLRLQSDAYFAEYFTEKVKYSQELRYAGPEARAVLYAPSKESQAVVFQEIMRRQQAQPAPEE